ncbi:MAG TPA: hypothetical protein VN829_16110 [Dongiaceae bacterium]|nr:hypothetical protein [Dongiaceae bacterium]
MSTEKTAWAVGALLLATVATAAPAEDLDGQPADIAPSAYLYRADRKAEENPPEAWILLMQRGNLPFDRPVDLNAPAVKQALCGLLWEEVRPLRRLELSWPLHCTNQPAPEELVVAWFSGKDDAAHTWWNPCTLEEAGKPQVSADGRTYAYAIPTETWGVVVAMRGQQEASRFAVPAMRAFVAERWKQMEVELEWGYEPGRAALPYGGRIETYDGRMSELHPLAEDTGTTLAGPEAWRSAKAAGSRRGVRFRLLYLGDSRWRRVWPYHAQAEDVARTVVTVRTDSGSFSFLAADLEHGPILAPEHGFFVRAANRLPAPAPAEAEAPAPAKEPPAQPGQAPFAQASSAASASEFLRELAAKRLATIRQWTREHAEQSWEGAVTAMRGTNLPSHPAPPYAPAMQVEVPSQRLTAQWNLGSWHLLRHAAKDSQGKWRFNDFPFGILASETYMVLRALDLQGMSAEAADGLDQWLRLPSQPRAVQGTHPWSKPDRPLGHFSDGTGCLTHAVGPEGAGGHMDAVHCMGPGAIMFTLAEHFRLTGDREWLKANAPRMKANAQWILRQRQVLAANLPGGKRLWSRGLQPAHVVTPDSERMHQQFYESEAYYWLAVNSMAEMLMQLDPAEGTRLAEEAESYRQDLLAAIDRSITLTPVVAVRDGTYRSFIPFAPYVRGFASGAWGWRRCQGHVGAIYWDTVQSADPLISPAGLLSPEDPRVQGHLDVLEDRLLLENDKVAARTPGFAPAQDWFSHASWQYQCGLERHANIHILAGDAPNFIRSMLNQYAVDIVPGEYTFREHTTTGPTDKPYEEACFLERFRMMLVMEQGDALWLARATPRAWLEQGQRIAVKNAPTHFGPVGYEILSDVDHGRITVLLQPSTRTPPTQLFVQLRHPQAAPITQVSLNGADWTEFDAAEGLLKLRGLQGATRLEVTFAR